MSGHNDFGGAETAAAFAGNAPDGFGGSGFDAGRGPSAGGGGGGPSNPPAPTPLGGGQAKADGGTKADGGAGVSKGGPTSLDASDVRADAAAARFQERDTSISAGIRRGMESVQQSIEEFSIVDAFNPFASSNAEKVASVNFLSAGFDLTGGPTTLGEARAAKASISPNPLASSTTAQFGGNNDIATPRPITKAPRAASNSTSLAIADPGEFTRNQLRTARRQITRFV